MGSFSKGLDQSYCEQLDDLKRYIKAHRLEDQIVSRFPAYTLHDMKHFEQVEKNLARLCAPLDLSPEERFCLSAASYAHDLGMAISDASMVEYYENRSDARKEHASRSEYMVLNELSHIFPDEELRWVIATLCGGHGRKDLNNMDFNDAYNIRVRLLTCLLMFADSLDLNGDRRNPKQEFSQEEFMGYTFLDGGVRHDPRILAKPELIHLSRLHWLRHYYSTIPSITAQNGMIPTVNIVFKGAVGVEKSADGQLMRMEDGSYMPDRRLALIEEIVLADPLDTYELIKPYIRDYLRINIEGLGDPIKPTLQARCVPTKLLFPEELVEVAYSGGVIRTREVPLMDRDNYRTVRIEPFFCRDDLQVSISIKISTLVPNELISDTVSQNHVKWVQHAAKNIWDIVLWRTDQYAKFVADELTSQPTGFDDVRRRLEAFRDAPQRIFDGELKKVYLEHSAPDAPYTSTKHISKYAIYKNGKTTKEGLYGRVLIRGMEQKNKYRNLCEKIVVNLGCQKNGMAAEEFVGLLRSRRIGFLLSSKTIIGMYEMVKKELSNHPGTEDLCETIDSYIGHLKHQLPEGFLGNENVNRYLLSSRPMEVSDGDDVMAIENDNFEYPWGGFGSFLSYIDEKWAYVVTLDGNVVGYVVIEIRDEKLLVTKMAVSSDHKRQRIGSYLLLLVNGIAREEGIQTVKLHVRETNTTAIQFYMKQGYQIINEMKGYYKRSTKESAIEMVKSVSK